MAELAKNYDKNLQTTGITPESQHKTRMMNKVLGNITHTASQTQKVFLAEFIRESQIEEALRTLANGEETGIKGLPYELWRSIHNIYKPTKEDQKPAFNIIKTLKIIFCDIEREGVTTGTDFATGWICPLYKRKIIRYNKLQANHTTQWRLQNIHKSLINETV